MVTARALAPLEPAARLGDAARGCRHGALLAMKGSSAAAEIEAAGRQLRRLRCAPPEILELTGPDGSSTATVVRVAHADPARLG